MAENDGVFFTLQTLDFFDQRHGLVELMRHHRLFERLSDLIKVCHGLHEFKKPIETPLTR